MYGKAGKDCGYYSCVKSFTSLLQTVERRQKMKERKVQQRSPAGFELRTLWFMVSILTFKPCRSFCSWSEWPHEKAHREGRWENHSDDLSSKAHMQKVGIPGQSLCKVGVDIWLPILSKIVRSSLPYADIGNIFTCWPCSTNEKCVFTVTLHLTTCFSLTILCNNE